MHPRSSSDFGYVVTTLANRLRPEAWNRERPHPRRSEAARNRQVVFLLGAGCSRQYGLPSFKELLTYFWQDCYHEQPDSSWTLETLRDRLDRYWQTLGPEERQKTLARYLKRVDGKGCPAYRRLASLASYGHIKAIINMNFDTLLEEALREENVPYLVSTSFTVQSDAHLMVYKPHGSIEGTDSQGPVEQLIRVLARIVSMLEEETRTTKEPGQSLKRKLQSMQATLNEIEDRLGASDQDFRLIVHELRRMEIAGLDDLRADLMRIRERLSQLKSESTLDRSDLILDIANSDLFSHPEEQRCAQQLLTGHDVVAMGYSGVDAKIAAALHAFPHGRDKRDKKIFVINFDRPDPRLLLVMAERASQDLLVSGEDAAFENFMEFLEGAVERPHSFDAGPVPAPSEEPTFMTRSERAALAECLRLALSIRAGINVADRSSKTIEAHGHDIYRLCLKLANAAGDCLAPPEKFLLHAAAFFHDLGYFAAYSGGNVLDYPGWRLLNRHGFKTRELMEKRLKIEKDAKIIPATYSHHEELTRDLLDICQFHATYEEETISISGDHQVRVSGREVNVRPRLLQALFAAAEDLAMEHPFLPSPDPIVAGQESRWIVEDPVLDLFLRRKKDEVVFTIERGKVIGRTHERNFSKKALWLLNMASRFVSRYALYAADKGWGIRFVCDPPRRILDPDNEIRISRLLAVALEQELRESLLRVENDIRSEVKRILDAARLHLDTVARELSKTRRESLAIPELAKQVLETTQRSISREWIAELRANAQSVEDVLARHELGHREIFRTPLGEIRKLDRDVRNLLRKNIPELSRGDILIHLAALESMIWETISLGEPTLAELASLTEKLGDADCSLETYADQPSVQPLKKPLSALAEGVCSLRPLLVAEGLAQIAASLAEISKKIQGGLDASATESISLDLESMVAYLRQLNDSKWRLKGVDSVHPMEGVDAVCQSLVLIQRRLVWIELDVTQEFLNGLSADLEEAVRSLVSLPLMKSKLARAEVWKRLRENQRELEKVYVQVEKLAVDNALTGLKHTRSLLEQLQRVDGHALPSAVPAELTAALKLLDKAHDNLATPPASYISSVLDLLVIYTLGGENQEEGDAAGTPRLEFDEPEPRVPLDNQVVVRALDWIKKTGHNPHSTLLDFYFRIAAPRREPVGCMERKFKNSFKKILYPSWRFFGRNLHDGIETILMAVACFDLGSSRFRDEAVSGIRHLLGDKVVIWEEDKQRAYGHHECTLCTSRLLYTFSHARRLFPDDELEGFAQVTGHGIDQTVGALLRYFLSRPLDDKAWWGLGCKAHDTRIKSADYLAWAARAVTFCLTVDREIADRTGESWLAEDCGLDDRTELLRLLEQRWTQLFDVNERDLLDLYAEEPHSLILGNIAVACLDLQRYGASIEGFHLERFQGHLLNMADKLAKTVLAIGNLSQLSRFFIWPVRLLQDSVGHCMADENPADQAIETCHECINSPIWIPEGPDAGSWGFNVKNTQAIIASLVEFWRYVLEDEERQRKFSRLFEPKEEVPRAAEDRKPPVPAPARRRKPRRPDGRKDHVA